MIPNTDRVSASTQTTHLLRSTTKAPKTRQQSVTCHHRLYGRGGRWLSIIPPPHDHPHNTTERVIMTFKNHLIAILCGTDPKFNMEMWDKLLPQALIIHNLLWASRINPQLFAYSQVYRAFDFNQTPPAPPPGTKVLVHKKPEVRETWAPHTVDVCYIGPAKHHYICFRVWVW